MQTTTITINDLMILMGQYDRQLCRIRPNSDALHQSLDSTLSKWEHEGNMQTICDYLAGFSDEVTKPALVALVAWKVSRDNNQPVFALHHNMLTETSANADMINIHRHCSEISSQMNTESLPVIVKSVTGSIRMPCQNMFPNENRSANRTAFLRRAYITVGENDLEATITNISESGIGLHSAKNICPGQIITISLNIDHIPKMRGVVVHCKAGQMGIHVQDSDLLSQFAKVMSREKIFFMFTSLGTFLSGPIREKISTVSGIPAKRLKKYLKLNDTDSLYQLNSAPGYVSPFSTKFSGLNHIFYCQSDSHETVALRFTPTDTLIITKDVFEKLMKAFLLWKNRYLFMIR